MNDDQLFRRLFLVWCLVFLPVGIYFRLKARTGEKLDRRQEGLFILVSLRLAGLAGMVGAILYLLDFRGMRWALVVLPTWSRWLGLILMGVASGLLVWMFRTLGKNLTDTVVTRKQHALVTTGPYRWVRHPFYVSAAILIVGSSLVTGNRFIFATGCVMFVLLIIRTR